MESCRYKGLQIDTTMCPIEIKINWINWCPRKISKEGGKFLRTFHGVEVFCMIKRKKQVSTHFNTALLQRIKPTNILDKNIS